MKHSGIPPLNIGNVGPQVRFSANVLLDPGSEIKSPGLNVLRDTIGSFKTYFGTGTSFIEFISIKMLENLLTKSIGKKNLDKSLRIVENVFVCMSNALKCVPIKAEAYSESLYNAEHSSHDEDVSWFFDIKEADPGYANSKTDPVKQCLDKNNVDWCDDWLLEGLQHCLNFDFGGSDDAVALPMQLAGNVARHKLRTKMSAFEGDKNIDKFSLQSIASDELFAAADICENVFVHKIVGISSNKACMIPESIVFKATTYDNLDKVFQLSSDVISNKEDEGKSDRYASSCYDNRMRANFNRVAVVDLAYGGNGSNSGGTIGDTIREHNNLIGNSQQARGLPVTYTFADNSNSSNQRNGIDCNDINSVDIFENINCINKSSSNGINNNDIYCGNKSSHCKDSHQQYSYLFHETQEEFYLSRVSKKLSSLQVDLLLCSANMLTSRLQDCLFNCGIAILPMNSAEELSAAATLAGATVVEDILGLQASDIGASCYRPAAVLDEINSNHHGNSQNNSNSSSNSNDSKVTSLLPIVSIELLLEYPLNQSSFLSNALQSKGDNDATIYTNNEEVEYGDENMPNNNNSNYNCKNARSGKGGKQFSGILIAMKRINHPHYQRYDHRSSSDSSIQFPPLPPPTAMVSVILCAPTAAMVEVLHERYHSCLYRLYDVLKGEEGKQELSVMPGGGLLELLCVIRIHEVILFEFGDNHINSCSASSCINKQITTTESPNDSYSYNDNNNNNNNNKDSTSYEVIEVLKAFQQSLLQYITSIMINNGISYSEAWHHVSKVMEILQSRCNKSSIIITSAEEQYNDRNGTVGNSDELLLSDLECGRNCNSKSSSILSFVSSLSNNEKFMLPKPIDLRDVYGSSGTSSNSCCSNSRSAAKYSDQSSDAVAHNVLDPVYVKIAALRSALLVVKQIHGCRQLYY